MTNKPLGRKAYGSIGHLPNSRLGPGDHCVPEGMADICTKKARDKHDKIVVQEKLDGSCTAVALVGGKIHALQRKGYLASTSPFEQHHLFAEWVQDNEDRFRSVLREGERIVGEWIAQAHGTKYHLSDHEPWAAFDLMVGTVRTLHEEFLERIDAVFHTPHTLHVGGPLSVEDGMARHESLRFPCDETEGLVYRVERKGRVDFLAKWVRPDKVDGCYLPENNGGEIWWNWWKPLHQNKPPVTF